MASIDNVTRDKLEVEAFKDVEDIEAELNITSRRIAKKNEQVKRILHKEETRARVRKVSQILKKNVESRTEEESAVLSGANDLISAMERRAKIKEQERQRFEEIEDSRELLEEKCKLLATAVKHARSLVVYTGAGISTAASIPDYRGPNGVWTLLKQGKPLQSADLSLAQPTFTHMCLAELFFSGIVKRVVSQNCDGLHLRSGLPAAVLSELHGNMFLEVCKKCQPVRQHLRLFDVTEKTAVRRHKTGRKCRRCRADLTDTIIHFGEKGSATEPPYNWQLAADAANRADVILCLGTSLKSIFAFDQQAWPRLLNKCKSALKLNKYKNLPKNPPNVFIVSRQIPDSRIERVLKQYPCLWGMHKPAAKRPLLYIVNLQWTPKDDIAALKINGKCDEVMRLLAEELNITVNDYTLDRDPLFTLATPLRPAELNSTSKQSLVCPESYRTAEVKDLLKRFATRQLCQLNARRKRPSTLANCAKKTLKVELIKEEITDECGVKNLKLNGEIKSCCSSDTESVKSELKFDDDSCLLEDLEFSKSDVENIKQDTVFPTEIKRTSSKNSAKPVRVKSLFEVGDGIAELSPLPGIGSFSTFTGLRNPLLVGKSPQGSTSEIINPVDPQILLQALQMMRNSLSSVGSTLNSLVTPADLLAFASHQQSTLSSSLNNCNLPCGVPVRSDIEGIHSSSITNANLPSSLPGFSLTSLPVFGNVNSSDVKSLRPAAPLLYNHTALSTDKNVKDILTSLSTSLLPTSFCLPNSTTRNKAHSLLNVSVSSYNKDLLEKVFMKNIAVLPVQESASTACPTQTVLQGQTKRNASQVSNVSTTNLTTGILPGLSATHSVYNLPSNSNTVLVNGSALPLPNLQVNNMASLMHIRPFLQTLPKLPVGSVANGLENFLPNVPNVPNINCVTQPCANSAQVTQPLSISHANSLPLSAHQSGMQPNILNSRQPPMPCFSTSFSSSQLVLSPKNLPVQASLSFQSTLSSLQGEKSCLNNMPTLPAIPSLMSLPLLATMGNIQSSLQPSISVQPNISISSAVSKPMDKLVGTSIHSSLNSPLTVLPPPPGALASSFSTNGRVTFISIVRPNGIVLVPRIPNNLIPASVTPLMNLTPNFTPKLASSSAIAPSSLNIGSPGGSQTVASTVKPVTSTVVHNVNFVTSFSSSKLTVLPFVETSISPDLVSPVSTCSAVLSLPDTVISSLSSNCLGTNSVTSMSANTVSSSVNEAIVLSGSSVQCLTTLGNNASSSNCPPLVSALSLSDVRSLGNSSSGNEISSDLNYRVSSPPLASSQFSTVVNNSENLSSSEPCVSVENKIVPINEKISDVLEMKNLTQEVDKPPNERKKVKRRKELVEKVEKSSENDAKCDPSKINNSSELVDLIQFAGDKIEKDFPKNNVKTIDCLDSDEKILVQKSLRVIKRSKGKNQKCGNRKIHNKVSDDNSKVSHLKASSPGLKVYDGIVNNVEESTEGGSEVTEEKEVADENVKLADKIVSSTNVSGSEPQHPEMEGSADCNKDCVESDSTEVKSSENPDQSVAGGDSIAASVSRHRRMFGRVKKTLGEDMVPSDDIAKFLSSNNSRSMKSKAKQKTNGSTCSSVISTALSVATSDSVNDTVSSSPVETRTSPKIKLKLGSNGLYSSVSIDEESCVSQNSVCTSNTGDATTHQITASKTEVEPCTDIKNGVIKKTNRKRKQNQDSDCVATKQLKVVARRLDEKVEVSNNTSLVIKSNNTLKCSRSETVSKDKVSSVESCKKSSETSGIVKLMDINISRSSICTSSSNLPCHSANIFESIDTLCAANTKPNLSCINTADTNKTISNRSSTRRSKQLPADELSKNKTICSQVISNGKQSDVSIVSTVTVTSTRTTSNGFCSPSNANDVRANLLKAFSGVSKLKTGVEKGKESVVVQKLTTPEIVKSPAEKINKVSTESLGTASAENVSKISAIAFTNPLISANLRAAVSISTPGLNAANGSNMLNCMAAYQQIAGNLLLNSSQLPRNLTFNNLLTFGRNRFPLNQSLNSSSSASQKLHLCATEANCSRKTDLKKAETKSSQRIINRKINNSLIEAKLDLKTELNGIETKSARKKKLDTIGIETNNVNNEKHETNQNSPLLLVNHRRAERYTPKVNNGVLNSVSKSDTKANKSSHKKKEKMITKNKAGVKGLVIKPVTQRTSDLNGSVPGWFGKGLVFSKSKRRRTR